MEGADTNGAGEMKDGCSGYKRPERGGGISPRP